MDSLFSSTLCTIALLMDPGCNLNSWTSHNPRWSPITASTEDVFIEMSWWWWGVICAGDKLHSLDFCFWQRHMSFQFIAVSWRYSPIDSDWDVNKTSLVCPPVLLWSLGNTSNTYPLHWTKGPLQRRKISHSCQSCSRAVGCGHPVLPVMFVCLCVNCIGRMATHPTVLLLTLREPCDWSPVAN